jgi:hypothetical protein
MVLRPRPSSRSRGAVGVGGVPENTEIVREFVEAAHSGDVDAIEAFIAVSDPSIEHTRTRRGRSGRLGRSLLQAAARAETLPSSVVTREVALSVLYSSSGLPQASWITRTWSSRSTQPRASSSFGTRSGHVADQPTRVWLCVERRRPESNRCKRLCRPLRNHSATAPEGHLA